MINGASVLGLVTARGGSKGVPRKNLREVGGKSMIARAVEAALASRHLDRVVISSDDREILDAASAAGCEVPFVRPAELARDESSHADVIDHALRSLDRGYDYLVLLQPTSPLRTAADIDGCVDLCVRSKAPAALSVTPFGKSPATVVRLDEAHRVSSMLGVLPAEVRRQDAPAFILNGAVYVCRCEWWPRHRRFLTEETVGYVMPPERSIDVDSEIDLLVANEYLRRSESAA